MISNEKLNEICYGCTIYYNKGKSKFYPSRRESEGLYITMHQAVEQHLSKESPYFQITKIELTEENKRRIYEWLAQNDK